MRFAGVFERGLFTQEPGLALFHAPCTHDLHDILHPLFRGTDSMLLKEYSKTYATWCSGKELK